MRSFETDVQKIKYKVLRAVAEHALNEKMEDVYYSVPLEVIPGRKPTMRCCVYKERAIVGERVHTALGGDRGDNVIQQRLPRLSGAPLHEGLSEGRHQQNQIRKDGN